MSYRPLHAQTIALRALLPEASFLGADDIAARAVTADSRDCRAGDVFVAICGTQRDGHAYVGEALARGATALVVETAQPVDVPQCVVPDSRSAYARLCQALAGWPAEGLQLVGITGTNGKTTTSLLLQSILTAAGYRAGLCGTLWRDDRVRREEATLTTPDAAELARWLAACCGNDCGYGVLEVSSHALQQRRLEGVGLETAVVTNITRDHLDYHCSAEDYRDVKRRVFGYVRHGGAAVVNADDPQSAGLVPEQIGRRVTFALHAQAEVTATQVERSLAGQRFVLCTPAGQVTVTSHLPGAHNLSNCLAAAAAAFACDVSPKAIARGIESVALVPGRLEPIDCGQPFSVFVDYAHTPDALGRCLTTLGALAAGRVICVFGAGGDRDREKRALMGRVVQSSADLAVVTSDNPRGEDPGAIIADILEGMRNRRHVHVEPDRRAAIAWALAEAQAGDCVLIAGKGHETHQIVNGRKIEFDDRKVAADCLRGEGAGDRKLAVAGWHAGGAETANGDELIDFQT